MVYQGDIIHAGEYNSGRLPRATGEITGISGSELGPAQSTAH